MNENVFRQLKIGVWLYFYLLIFEGALRKWVLPELASPLLIIRDPIAIWIVYKAIQNNIWRPNGYVNLMWGITVLSFILTLFFGHGNIPVAIYGMRITLFHFPLIFVIGNILEKEDVLKMGEVVLWITIGMTLLVAVQFYSPQSAWVNRGIGGDMEGSGFSGASGFFRVPGTFSFTNGLALFYGLSAAYILYFWLGENSRKVSKHLLMGSTIALLAAIPLSVSRTVLFEIILSMGFLLLISGKNKNVIKKVIGIVISSFAFLIILNSFNFFRSASTVFTERYTIANNEEGGLQGTVSDRLLGGMYSTIVDSEISFWGLGLGLGSKVGSKLITGGTKAYLISEGEWGRIIGEMGFVLGLILIIIRGSLVLEFFKKAWTSSNSGNNLPWLLLSFGAFNILQGQWSQPTSLGFSMLIGGLIIASFKDEQQ